MAPKARFIDFFYSLLWFCNNKIFCFNVKRTKYKKTVSLMQNRLVKSTPGSISPMFYEKLFRAKILKAPKAITYYLAVFLRFWDLQTLKQHVNMFVKLTSGCQSGEDRSNQDKDKEK